MNVIVSNRQKDIIDNANIDAIKDLNGLFNVNDLINKFKNYFFSKMILDATSVVDFATRDVLTTLANEIGAEKLIILLPSNPEPPTEFKKLLIELKIYNFTNNIDDVVKFIENPNTYEDAIKLVDDSFNSDIYVDNSIKDQDETTLDDISEDNQDMAIGVTNDYSNQSSLGDILSRINVKEEGTTNTPSVENSVDNNMNNNTNNDTTDADMSFNPKDNIYQSMPVNNEIVENSVVDDNLSNNNESKNTFLISDDFDNTYNNVKPQRIVIGVKNVTVHAGSTSLIYMLHKMATVNLKKNVLSVEIGKNDFRLFRDNSMISVNENDAKDTIDNSHNEVIFVDLNEYDGNDICNEILYLVEPSTIKLNGLMAVNRNIFKELNNKKVLLNKSLLSSSDVRILEGEAGIHFFYCIEPLNDRIFNDTISKLLDLLGIK